MSTFTIGGMVSTFRDRIQGSSQGVADIWELTLSVLLPDEPNWITMLSQVTTKHGIHVPLGGQAIIDVVNGPGSGTLVCGLGTTTAILTSLNRNEYLPRHQSLATAQFLILDAWVP